MSEITYHVLGIMSGTSLDGIDLAEITFIYRTEEGWSFRWGVTETIPYESQWLPILNEAVHFSEGRLKRLNVEYTHYLAGIISSFIDRHELANLDAVCSHGHTVLHQPDEQRTLQIGNLPELADKIQQKVVCDFRSQDVVLGGQGAPLVPIGDRLLFSEYDYCLNLGGFANCSFEREGVRIAYDICPVNIVLNQLTRELGMPFDKGGAIARAGVADRSLLKALNALPYYQEPPPKSLGLEWVQEHIIPLLKASGLSIKDQIATFTEHAAYQLALQFHPNSRILSTGGGTFNSYLIERFSALAQLRVTVPDKQLIDFKEALVFGLLGVLKLRDEVNCLSSVTGAEMDHCSGYIFDH